MKMLPYVLILFAPVWAGAQTVTINFDGSGAESGITVPGTGDFEYMGSIWSGGEVGTLGVPALYASGSYSYKIAEGETATVQFTGGVSEIRFFFAHGSSVPAGEAIVMDGEGTELGRLASLAGTTFGDPDNFVEFSSSEASIFLVEFTGGSIDNFRYSFAPEGGDFVMDHRIEGAWFNPATPGQGLLFDYIPGETPQLFAAWFVFDVPVGESDPPYSPPTEKIGGVGQRWLTAQGDVTSPGEATLTLFSTTGGYFNSNNPTQTSEVGQARVTFSACNAGQFHFEFNGTGMSGSFPLKPVDPSLAECGQ